MQHYPHPGSFLLQWAGDLLEVTLRLDTPHRGRAVFRTNLGLASVRRREVIACTESGEPVLARDWHDVPMRERSPGEYTVSLTLTEVGLFEGKACFFPHHVSAPEWPEGDNLKIKVEPALTACANTVYSAFVRQFGHALNHTLQTEHLQKQEQVLDEQGYTVVPPSGTFRDLIRHLDHIIDHLRFRIVQLLPVHPTPVTYARMGRYGSPFAALDFLSVDPALAEFDTHATPLDQFRELIDAVHSRGSTLFMDLPANHTGWAATLQTHHPDWYRHEAGGDFVSPGAWGVIWADLVELDYSEPRLRAYMAEVFLFWCRQGVDGFRCDAGYMIPAETWCYLVACVREEFPDTVFLLEGLGGKVEVTERLLTDANLNWAYSELFQTEDRGAMEWYLPRTIPLAERCGPLIHFAETHDNNRLAARGEVYARLRVALSALFSHQGAFGIANGVEWFATEKIDVHSAASLNWDAKHNQVSLITRINALLSIHPAFGPSTTLSLVHKGSGPVLALLRKSPLQAQNLLVLVNLDCDKGHVVHWADHVFNAPVAWDLLKGEALTISSDNAYPLQPGQVCCLSGDAQDLSRLDQTLQQPFGEPAAIARRRRNLMALRVREALLPPNAATRLVCEQAPDDLGRALTADPRGFCVHAPNDLPRCVVWQWPTDLRRQVMVPEGHVLLVCAQHPFRVALCADECTQAGEQAIPLDNGQWGAFLTVTPYDSTLDGTRAEVRTLATTLYTPESVRRDTSTLMVLPPAEKACVITRVSGVTIRREESRCAVLSNGAGAMSQARAAWGEIRSQYDCLLGVNTDAHVPVDKQIFWTRCRAWLRYRGYSQEINQTCLAHFTADPAGRFAEWHFQVPSGMGRWVPLTFRLEMAWCANQARLIVSRQNSQGGMEPDDNVTVVMRPDIEWRSFHEKTKAFLGPESAWPAAIRPKTQGFDFRPTPDETLGITTDHGVFHHDPAWLYMVSHEQERERGLDANSDLFSPGWFELTLTAGQQAKLTACRKDDHTPKDAELWPEEIPLKKTLKLPDALTQALSLYIVRRDTLRTVIAGYPWFLDWGRDTLIALRGVIAAGRHDEALAILREFGRFEEQGTLPNIIHGDFVGNRDTSDAPLWFCIAAGDLMHAIGDEQVLQALCGKRTLREILVSILTHVRAGTPNGIRMDPDSALLYSPPHFTWMDTNYPAATPREGYPIEIQALWVASLRLVAGKVDALWNSLAEQATLSIENYFPNPDGGLFDCLRANSGIPASQAVPEDTVRPNQLLAVTLGALISRERQISVLQACECLLVPGAIRSLADRPVQIDLSVHHKEVLLNDPHQPYQGVYQGDEDTHRKPAYHNGTAWTWPFPLYVEGLAQVYGPSARQTGRALLGSAVELLNRGTLCHMPEICDGDAPHTPRGCGAQAWGMTELLRVWLLITALREHA